MAEKEMLVKSSINLNGNNVKNIADPVEPKDAVNLQYLQKSIKAGSFQDSVNNLQKDNTLIPEKTLDPIVRYIITDKDNLNAGFGAIPGIGNGDIVLWNGTSFVIDTDVSETSQEIIIVYNEGEDRFYQYVKEDAVWEVIAGLGSMALGEGLTTDGDTIIIDGTVAQKVTFEIGDGVTSVFDLNHKLGNSTPTVTIKDNITGQQVNAFVEFLGIDNVSIEMSPIPTLKQFKVTIVG